MELWIRSQDKLDLMKCKSIHIEEIPSSTEVAILCYASGDKYSTIGYYKSKERALEVLDEIQNMIKPTLINTEYHSEIKQDIDKLSFDVVMQPIEDKITYIQPDVVVYEMPKD